MSDDTNTNPALPSDDDLVDSLQMKRYQMILDGRAPDKEMLQLIKHTVDTAMAKKRLQSDNENSEKDRQVVQAIAHNLRQSNQNPFITQTPATAQDGDTGREPPKPDGPLCDLEIAPENISTALGSPDYEDVVSKS